MYVMLQCKVYAKLWEKLLNLKAVKYTHLYASTRVTMVACGQGIGRWLGDNSQRDQSLVPFEFIPFVPAIYFKRYF